ncbi:hypothetical protein FB567DRAFT_345310 [Paraphoma chrysanthemicola]|uniref:Uncharacterized protein n=1 Tax=Paraphoma chrysanthemicola TaxID=798071 RepID=A0A8K0VYD4_9PLEO|nr:hypothetical protein FB567DRAFT_345310 [Paraphoma chrysanthemicola]
MSSTDPLTSLEDISSAQQSPLLRLPAELRLAVYRHHFRVTYRPLPTNGRDNIFAYWRCYSLPSGLARTNRQLYSELQAFLREVRPLDEPDIICSLPLPFSPNGLLAIVDEITALEKSGSDLVDTHLAILVSYFAHPSCRGQRIPTAENIALLKELVRKIVLRMRNSNDGKLRVRFASVQSRVRELSFVIQHGVGRMFNSTKPSKCGLSIEASFATPGTFSPRHMSKMKGFLPAATWDRITWTTATEEEQDMILRKKPA